jgi:hypothetical protein
MLHEVVATLLNLTGLSEIDESVIENAVEFSSFSNMKKLERENFFHLQPLGQRILWTMKIIRFVRGL